MTYLSTRLLLIGAIIAFGLVNVVNAGSARCKSSAYEQSEAEAFCHKQLQCPAKTPPEEMICRGTKNNWKCWCEQPKGSGKPEEQKSRKCV